MNCSECEGLILDGSARSPECERHLAGCPDCRAFFQSQQAVDELLSAGLRNVHASPDFDARLRRRMRTERSLHLVRRVIASLEILFYVLLAGAALFAASAVAGWQLPGLAQCMPAIAAGSALTIVWHFVCSETSAD